VARRREETVFLPAHAFHHVFRQLTLQQLDERTDGAGAVAADRLPSLWRGHGDVDLHFVDIGTADQGPHAAAPDLQIDDRAVANIGSTARQAIFEIGIAFEIVAPSLAPKTLRDLASFKDDRVDGA